MRRRAAFAVRQMSLQVMHPESKPSLLTGPWRPETLSLPGCRLRKPIHWPWEPAVQKLSPPPGKQDRRGLQRRHRQPRTHLPLLPTLSGGARMRRPRWSATSKASALGGAIGPKAGSARLWRRSMPRVRNAGHRPRVLQMRRSARRGQPDRLPRSTWHFEPCQHRPLLPRAGRPNAEPTELQSWALPRKWTLAFLRAPWQARRSAGINGRMSGPERRAETLTL